MSDRVAGESRRMALALSPVDSTYRSRHRQNTPVSQRLRLASRCYARPCLLAASSADAMFRRAHARQRMAHASGVKQAFRCHCCNEAPQWTRNASFVKGKPVHSPSVSAGNETRLPLHIQAEDLDLDIHCSNTALVQV